MTATVRAFIGARLEGEAAERIVRIQARLRRACEKAGWKASWPVPGNLHITLKFLGDIELERVGPIGQALEALRRRAAIDLEVGGLGAFPPRRRPSVLWIGVRHGGETVTEMVQEIDMSLEPLGLARETRPFHPHVTLARVKRAGSRTETIWSGLDAQAGAARISEVVLYRSHLESTGARYESLVRVALDGQTGSTSPAPE